MTGNVTIRYRQIFRAISNRSMISLLSRAVVGCATLARANTEPASARVVVEERPATASRHAAPIRPITSAWTLTNIGKDSESKVNEQAAAASAAPASAAHSSRSSGSPLRRRATSADDHRHQEEGGQGDDPDQAELDRGLQELVVENVRSRSPAM